MCKFDSTIITLPMNKIINTYEKNIYDVKFNSTITILLILKFYSHIYFYFLRKNNVLHRYYLYYLNFFNVNILS